MFKLKSHQIDRVGKLNVYNLGRKPTGLFRWLGPVGSAFGTFAMLCCFGWTGLATFLPLVGLGFLVRFSVALRLIWLTLALTVLGLALSFRRHRQPWPLVTAALGTGLLLYPRYHGLEVVVLLGLAYSGLGVLFLSAGLDMWCSWRVPLTCQVKRSQS